ncbi:MAG: hypothetical protein ACK5P3_28540 [Dolichospermum sp.]
MDIAAIVKLITPCLPFLLTMGNKAAEGASQKVGEDVWNQAKVIWDKLWPKVEAKEEAKKAATKAQQNPDDDDLQAAFRVQIREILEADTELAKEITKILQTQKSDDSSSSVNAQAYDESTQFNTGRDVNNPTYDMRIIKSPK